ncbi:hypothetical protein Pcinc_016694 [Petrolisthes cinctipes]|uniref:Uncharacterized protein n=1 Tax=Petrolisthes cinctipes TaxID=88211 RepID=A0AAE1FS88_PETCI|nr:hypothetical protein Pcinc_016694 [Petrolisthes cinctipes]
MANGVYVEAEQQFNNGARDVSLNARSPHKWWSTLKSAVFGSDSSLPPLVGDGGSLVYEPGDPSLPLSPSSPTAKRLVIEHAEAVTDVHLVCFVQLRTTPNPIH